MKLSPEIESIYKLQSYGAEGDIEGVAVIPLRRFHDQGGAMTELLRLREAPPQGLDGFEAVQINYSTLHPGAIKAFHVHREQTDIWFVPPEDRLLLVLVDVRDGSPTAGRRKKLLLGDGNSALVRIPPGVAHGCRNVGLVTARVIYMTDRVFSPEPDLCDEGRLPWDFAGADIWDPPRE
jgi:dTDP-4-dehydrorhamnose 3,5-epimerase